MFTKYLWIVYLQVADLENLKLLIYSFKDNLFQINMSWINDDEDDDSGGRASVDDDNKDSWHLLS